MGGGQETKQGDAGLCLQVLTGPTAQDAGDGWPCEGKMAPLRKWDDLAAETCTVFAVVQS